MPPPTLLCAYAGQIVGEKNPFAILKKSLLPIAAAMLVGILIVVFAQQIASLLALANLGKY
jgi:TRAP-type C4-dicarboxylate transport system permease large subunit